jgi:methylase of polypeptide subunit release factors
MKLNERQAEQIRKQLEQHEHKSYTVDVELAPNHVLRDFSVHEGVFRPDITAAIYLARWLFYNNGEYADRSVIDIGCGSGLQGIVTGIYGASNLTSVDISEKALENTTENVRRYGLEQRSQVIESDLFSNVDSEGKLVIFNHPFFPDNPIEDKLVSRSMLGGEDLIHRFFDEVIEYLSSDGRIVMSYFHLAGDTNNPSIQGPKHHFRVAERFKADIGDGLQQGQFSIYELKR